MLETCVPALKLQSDFFCLLGQVYCIPNFSLVTAKHLVFDATKTTKNIEKPWARLMGIFENNLDEPQLKCIIGLTSAIGRFNATIISGKGKLIQNLFDSAGSIYYDPARIYSGRLALNGLESVKNNIGDSTIASLQIYRVLRALLDLRCTDAVEV